MNHKPLPNYRLYNQFHSSSMVFNKRCSNSSTVINFSGFSSISLCNALFSNNPIPRNASTAPGCFLRLIVMLERFPRLSVSVFTPAIRAMCCLLCWYECIKIQCFFHILPQFPVPICQKALWCSSLPILSLMALYFLAAFESKQTPPKKSR